MSAVSKKSLPEVVVLNRQRAVPVELAWLRRFAAQALSLCACESADGLYALRELEEVVVVLVSDQRIDQIHREFMNIPGATDVITFEHGEIVISAQTAQRCAAEFGHSIQEEVALYLVHGLLHLNGFLDATEQERTQMHAVQDRIWRECLDLFGRVV